VKPFFILAIVLLSLPIYSQQKQSIYNAVKDGSIITVKGYVIKEGTHTHIFILSAKNEWRGTGSEYALLRPSKELRNEWDEKAQSGSYYSITGEYSKNSERFRRNMGANSKYLIGSIEFNKFSLIESPISVYADVNSSMIPLVQVVSEPTLKNWLFTITVKFLLDHSWLIKVIYIFVILLGLLNFVTGCICFSKANLPWWGGLIPIYNCLLFLKMAKTSRWWFFALLLPVFLRLNTAFLHINIPPVNYLVQVAFILFYSILGFVISVRLAKSFNKSALFAAGLFVLPIIFIPILAFGSSKYNFDSN